ncbi:MAG: symmetrical bis(5'-nucleosyl)-tetraphosphatase [Zetaproteobacteria bacterium]|nr:MAG: symmetrical bis(5'-nucleosyl)-tetraphosphatase [Zetaproteobacteria bacterium]
MTVYAVGDIQGCVRELEIALDRVRFDAAKDRLWCVGDLVNRGPASLEVLRLLASLGDACTAVLGNHDLLLLAFAARDACPKDPGLARVLRAHDAHERLEWLRHRPFMHSDADLGWMMVHAGLHPEWTIAEAMGRAAALQALLQGSRWREFAQILVDEEPAERQPACAPMKRAVFNAAVFTRTRYCTADGRFNWKVRSGQSKRKGDAPWYAHQRLTWRVPERRLVFGHWAAQGLVLDQPHVLGLDSGCVWGGALTMAELLPGGEYRLAARVESPGYRSVSH